MNETPVKVLYSVRDLSKVLGRSVAALERDVRAGRLPKPIRIGRSVKWRAIEISGWIENGCPHDATWAAIREAMSPKQPTNSKRKQS